MKIKTWIQEGEKTIDAPSLQTLPPEIYNIVSITQKSSSTTYP